MNLSPDQWQTLSALLDQALELPPAERSAWMARIPALAPEIGQTLARLLAQGAEAESADFMSTLPKLIDDVSPAPAPGRQAGDTVGAYRLLREIGRGGMGAVWLAERVDGQLKRPVALKLPHLSGESSALSERFARERDILAALNHPNIARLYDAGLTEQGQPFLALEYVEGRTLLDDCAARGLGLRQRLDRFAQVLEAVKYAHAHLVVHRDLKPSNILVTADGQVKLLDFGIAKLLAEGEAGVTELTRLGGRAMTLGYASPEQILGQPVTTATDVYSLGVLLCELLCGVRPYRLKRQSQGALEEAILDADAPPPSTLAADASVARALRGDLDTIVLKALRKRPEQRYDGAASLAEDLRRHAANLPVLAQADTRWYRWSRFLVRNWMPVSAIASVFVALVAGTGVALWQAKNAQQAQARADEVKGFIASIFTDTRPAQDKGGMATAAELLMRASERVPRELVGDPRVAAELDHIIAEGLVRLGEFDKAREHLEKALTRDRDALGDHSLAVLRIKLLLASAYVVQGTSAVAQPLLVGTVRDLRLLGRAGAGDLVEALRMLANIQSEHGGDEALATAREGVAVADRWLAAEDPRQLVAQSTLLSNLRLRNRIPEALTVARRAAELARKMYGTQRPNEALAGAEEDLAFVLTTGDRPAEAATLARQALTDISALQSGETTDVCWANGVLAQALSLSGQINDAIVAYQRAIKILAGITKGPDIDLAFLHQRLGVTHLEARRPAEALIQMQIAEQMMADAAGDGTSPRARERHLDRAETLIYLRRLDEAAGLMDGVVRQLEQPGSDDPTQQWARVAQLRSMALRFRSQPQAAIELASAALRRANNGPLGPRSGAALRVALAQAQLDAGENQAARSVLEQALAQYQTAQVGPSPRLTDALVGLGRAELALGSPASALAAFKQAHDYWQQFDAHSLWAAEAQFWYGRALVASGQSAGGRRLIEQARSRLARSPLAEHRRLAADTGAALRS